MIKIIPGLLHHGVDKDGNVYSRFKQYSIKGRQGIITTINSEWRKLGLTKTRYGYLQAGIGKKSYRVNRLVAMTFISNPEGKQLVCHKNGVKTDNRVENLYWGTALENAQDSLIHGHYLRGSRNPMAKLDNERVKEIWELRKTGKPFYKIAEIYGVSKKLVMLVCQRRIWKHVILN